MPVVSIIVPAYNVAAYIGECLDSLRAQTLADIEIIVVDSASTDDTVRVVTTYQQKDKRIVLKVLENNGGPSMARLTGAQLAQASCLGFVDGDDQVEPEMYASMYTQLLTHAADIVECGMRKIRLGQPEYFFVPAAGVVTDSATAIARSVHSLCNKLIKREIFLDQHVDHCLGMYYEDMAMLPQLFVLAKRFVFLENVFYNYMQRHISIMRSISIKHIQDSFKSLEIVYTTLVAQQLYEKLATAYAGMRQDRLYDLLMKILWGTKTQHEFITLVQAFKIQLQQHKVTLTEISGRFKNPLTQMVIWGIEQKAAWLSYFIVLPWWLNRLLVRA